MSCNGCRVLRKGCSENCILRPCLQWIDSAEAQGHATVFVAKFFGRAGLMSFISAVPETQRSALFQSLLFEAAGRTVNPVNGAVGLMGTGNWNVCQAAVETVLRGGTLRPIQEFLGGLPEMDEASDCTQMFKLQESNLNSRSKVQKRRRVHENEAMKMTNSADLDLSLMPGFGSNNQNNVNIKNLSDEYSEESGTTTCLESGFGDQNGKQRKLLNLFN